MDDLGILATAQRVLAPRFPIEAGPYRLVLTGPFTSDHFLLAAPLSLEKPGDGSDTPQPAGEGSIALAEEANARGEDGLAAFLEGWAAALHRVFAACAACETAMRPTFYLPDLGCRRVFQDRPARDAKTAADYEAAVLHPSLLGRLLRPSREALPGLILRFLGALRATLPAKGKDVELRLADVPATQAAEILFPDGLAFALELATYDGGGLRDLKQQSVVLVPWWAAVSQPDRAEEYLRGWARALKVRFQRTSRYSVETLMPHDFAADDALELEKPVSAADFEYALLKRWKV